MKIERGKLVQLEALRGFAALYVVLHHAVPMLDPPPLLLLPFRFGQEAVVLFFLISGFVIHHSYRGGRMRYLGARFLRLYPVFVAALAVSYISASALAGRLLPPDLPVLVGNLLMLQDRGHVVEPYMGNTPLWSLSYEAFFYLAYLVAMQTRRPHQVALIASLAGLGLMLVFPFQGFRLLAYLMIWWAGVALCEAWRGSWRPLISVGLALSLATVIFSVLASQQGREFGAFPLLELRHFGSAAILTAAFVLWARAGWRGFSSSIGPFAAVAPISYALYALHYPLLRATPSLSLPVWLGLPAMLAIAFALAWVLERPVQRFVRAAVRWAALSSYAHLLKTMRARLATERPTGTAAFRLATGPRRDSFRG